MIAMINPPGCGPSPRPQPTLEDRSLVCVVACHVVKAESVGLVVGGHSHCSAALWLHAHAAPQGELPLIARTYSHNHTDVVAAGGRVRARSGGSCS